MMKQDTKLVIGGIAHPKDVETFYDSLEKEEKKFENHIIAYIDFLGMKQKMKKTSSYESLQILKFLMQGTQVTANYISNINAIEEFNIKIFSDNIVIAQKINEEKLCEQIVSTINLVAAIQFHALLQFDFWLRGGITIGELYIDDSVVWGLGLIEAYSIENNLANYPRVVISKKIFDAYEECDKKSFNLCALVKEDFDGLCFVDFWIAAPNLDNIPMIAKFLEENAKQYIDEDDRVKQKINWVIAYFNSYCSKFKDRGDYVKYILSFI